MPVRFPSSMSPNPRAAWLPLYLLLLPAEGSGWQWRRRWRAEQWPASRPREGVRQVRQLRFRAYRPPPHRALELPPLPWVSHEVLYLGMSVGRPLPSAGGTRAVRPVSGGGDVGTARSGGVRFWAAVRRRIALRAFSSAQHIRRGGYVERSGGCRRGFHAHGADTSDGVRPAASHRRERHVSGRRHGSVQRLAARRRRRNSAHRDGGAAADLSC